MGSGRHSTILPAYPQAIPPKRAEIELAGTTSLSRFSAGVENQSRGEPEIVLRISGDSRQKVVGLKKPHCCAVRQVHVYSSAERSGKAG